MNDFQQEAELLKLSFQQMYLQKGRDQEPHRELHAANLLESESEWCTRRYVLMNLFPQEVQKPELKSWDWKREAIFEDGWVRHRKIQALFRKYANVVQDEKGNLELDLTRLLVDDRLFLSPDAILHFGSEKYLVEIKGINHDEYVGHPNLYEWDENKVNGYRLVKKARKGIVNATLEEAMKLSQTVYKAVIQANNYLFFTDLQKAILLIENKNNQDFKVYVMERDEELFRPYEFRVDEINGNTYMVKNHGLKMLSERVCHSPQDKLAQQCPMRDLCFSERVDEAK